MKYLLTLSYDGSKYQGYGTQPHHNTVQDTLQLALMKLFDQEIKTTAASRTDRGVHALDQKVMISVNTSMQPIEIKKALNALLPNSIVINFVELVGDSFHPRYDVREKTYRYYITMNKDPFSSPYKLYYPYKLDINAMNEAANHLVGRHDFSAFCASNTDVVDKTRCITSIQWLIDGEDLIFEISGNGFLYNMVRIIVGTLVEVGQGKIKPNDVKKILDARDRKLAKKTFPPNGLYLVKITY